MTTKTTTPTEISDKIVELCSKLDSGQEPRYIPVKPWRGSRVDNCFYNIEDKTKADGGHVQYGWTIWENPGLLIEAEFHAVWVTPAGELLDITEKSDSEQQILFLPDNTRVWQREMVDNIRVPLVDTTYTRRLIQAGEAQFRLRKKYWDRESGVSKIPLWEAQRLQQNTAPDRPQLGAVFPKTGRNQPCPCGSGKKYKKCHGSVL